MKLTRTTVYAIQAAVALSETPGTRPISSRQLALRGNMPERFLLQVLRKLVSRGLLHSTPGISGGYYLARPPEQITILEILDVFENPLLPSEVTESPGLAPAARERLVDCLMASSCAARQNLEKFTVSDLQLDSLHIIGTA
jgi:Rrf2 family cysteine metabolism transcriptional repressor